MWRKTAKQFMNLNFRRNTCSTQPTLSVQKVEIPRHDIKLSYFLVCRLETTREFSERLSNYSRLVTK